MELLWLILLPACALSMPLLGYYFAPQLVRRFAGTTQSVWYQTGASTHSPNAMSDLQDALLTQGKKRFKRLLEKSGGTYTEQDILSILTCTHKELEQLIENKAIVHCKLDGDLRFPKAQFDANQRLLPGINDIQNALPEGTSPNGACLFMLIPCESGKSPLELLAAGYPVENLIPLARNHFTQGS